MQRGQDHIALVLFHGPQESSSSDVDVPDVDSIAKLSEGLRKDRRRRCMLRGGRFSGKESARGCLHPAPETAPRQPWSRIRDEKMKLRVIGPRTRQQRVYHEPQEINSAAPGDEIMTKNAYLHPASMAPLTGASARAAPRVRPLSLTSLSASLRGTRNKSTRAQGFW